MILLESLICAAVLCGVVFLCVWLKRKGNRVAFWLSVPYALVASFGLVLTLRSIGPIAKLGRQEAKIEDVRPLAKLSVDDSILLVACSNVKFSNGSEYSGGLVRADVGEPIDRILNANGVERPRGAALIWVTNRRPSMVRISGDLLFISEGEGGTAGVWIGWVKDEEVSSVRRMDGS